MNKLVCIIPAQEKNNYSKDGDLVSWGQSNLLAWKISQLSEVIGAKNIFISTSSKKIIRFANEKKIKVLKRTKIKKLGDVFKEAGNNFKKCDILWANPTSPFISPKTIKKIISVYRKSRPKDGLVTCVKINEYFLDDRKIPLDVKLKKEMISRKNIKPLFKITNGIYLSDYKIYQNSKPFGHKPKIYLINWLSSLEINTFDDLNIYKLLLAHYLKKEK